MGRLVQFLVGGLVAVAVLATGACGSDEPTGPDTGALDVLLTMEGTDLDPNGGTLIFNDEVVGTLVRDVRFRMESVEVGIHVIEVTGIEANCTSLGTNERNVTVRAGQRAEEQFSFLCESTGGKDPGDGGEPVD
ncbi:MAG: hypothetical protein WBO43_15725 [Gemmatimonadota bacterium]|jgi:hypothetical protein